MQQAREEKYKREVEKVFGTVSPYLSPEGRKIITTIRDILHNPHREQIEDRVQ
ncbi:MAG: hypothetical protein LBF65_00285 [Holosporales bacterium]|nr:hypothetical protein [Holosporales bacterium]